MIGRAELAGLKDDRERSERSILPEAAKIFNNPYTSSRESADHNSLPRYRLVPTASHLASMSSFCRTKPQQRAKFPQTCTMRSLGGPYRTHLGRPTTQNGSNAVQPLAVRKSSTPT
jgi:hypothetical protein